jgi:ribosomal protein S8
MARKMETTAVDLTHSSSILWIADVYSIATNASRVNLTDIQTGYIGEFEEIDDHRNGKVVVQLNGRLNKTGVISPRYNVALSDMEKWVVKLLPSRQFGYIVLTTSSGIMDHEEARRKHVSGKIIGFFY